MNKKNHGSERSYSEYESSKINAQTIRKSQKNSYLIFIFLFAFSLFLFLDIYQENKSLKNTLYSLRLEAEQFNKKYKIVSKEAKNIDFKANNMESVLKNKKIDASLIRGKVVLPSNIKKIPEYKVCAQKVDNYFSLFCKSVSPDQQDFEIYLPLGSYYIYAEIPKDFAEKNSIESQSLYFSGASTPGQIKNNLSNNAKILSVSKDKKEVNNIFLSDTKTCNSKSTFQYCILD